MPVKQVLKLNPWYVGTTAMVQYGMQLWVKNLLELSNPEDRFAVAVCKRDVTVGHVPKRISSICSSFLQRDGTVTC